ncbi:MAG: hypothetical protein D5R97_01720 [Candidatus Syntrophonatronum acetioxidans]|uniref:Uncharacterized protein n=1 Tax=Candidatus Syntrophonatronum acetioxidans TaxID=1795816 RepID=A0A424YHP8_9FIRM|nr:MAG: hypothetical protein D5R97_01720 [Candidatus Syntrophonatronum acetioxidans]
MHCPLCKSIDTGQVGTSHYYCWHCLIEFSINNRGEVKIYYIEKDGSLVDMSDFFQGKYELAGRGK